MSDPTPQQLAEFLHTTEDHPPFNPILTQFYDDIEREHDSIRTLGTVAIQATMLVVFKLCRIQEREMWRDAYDDSGEHFGTWTAYLAWAQQNLRISKATFHRGLRGYIPLKLLGVTNEYMINIPPATLDRVSRAIVVSHIEVLEDGGKEVVYTWHPAIVEEAERVGIPPIEKVQELLQLTEPEILPAIRGIVGQDDKIHYEGEYNVGDRSLYLAAFQNELIISSFEIRGVAQEVADDLQKRLRCTFADV